MLDLLEIQAVLLELEGWRAEARHMTTEVLACRITHLRSA